jgi:hypothetical protein
VAYLLGKRLVAPATTSSPTRCHAIRHAPGIRFVRGFARLRL